MMSKVVSAILVALALLISPVAGASTNIVVPNFSFELPTTYFATPDMDSWQKTDQPFWYTSTNPWTQLTGQFINYYNTNDLSTYIYNAEGYQAAFLFALPGVGIFQDYDSIGGTNTTPTHEFDALYKPGKSYALTAGFIGGGGGMFEGESAQLVLYYRDASNNFVTLSSTTIIHTTNTFPDRNHFVDFTASIPVIATTNAAAGQHIGVGIYSTVDFSLYGGYWDVDNVRLAESPASLQLISPHRDTNGLFGFTLVSDTNRLIQVLRSSTLGTSVTNWTPVATVTNLTGTVSWKESSGTNSNARFYSARLL